MSSYQALPGSNTSQARQALRILYKVNVNYLVTYVYVLYLKLVWSWLSFEGCRKCVHKLNGFETKNRSFLLCMSCLLNVCVPFE
ncbi:hypothetical protein HanIR_Chr15g0752221 [Helianthus annuus]|nr:hypothetical protein HanIR_Chr15g0752221 [Helianthus annuus]